MLAQLSPERARGVLMRASGFAVLAVLAGPPSLQAQSASQAALVRVEVVAPAAAASAAVSVGLAAGPGGRAAASATVAAEGIVQVVVDGALVASWDAPRRRAVSVRLPAEHADRSADVLIRIET